MRDIYESACVGLYLYQRDHNGNMSVVPDPDWKMILEIEPREIWAWSDDEATVIH